MSLKNLERQAVLLFFILVVPVALGVGIPEAPGANIDTCTTISTPSIYTLTGNMSNSKTPNCIYITTSDVVSGGSGYITDNRIYKKETSSNLTISDIQIVNVSKNTAVVTWQTNEQSDSSIKYGKYNINYTLQGYNSSPVTNHSIKLSNLSPATTYYFVVNSTDISGNSNGSQELSFATLSVFNNLSIAVVYERVADKMQNEIERNMTNEIELLKSTRTDIIFRGWWQERIILDDCTQVLSSVQQQQCENLSLTYTHLNNSVLEIKRTLPDSIFIGAVPAQQIYSTTYNPDTHQSIQYPDTWYMSLDPAKLGITGITKEEFQCGYAKNRTWLNESFDCGQYNPANVTAYFPDITNESFKALLLSLAKEQIDSGADGIWFDGLFTQAGYMAELTNNTNHSAVNASYFASSMIIDDIHNYKQRVYTGTWARWVKLPYPPPNIDFTTVTPSEEEVLSQILNESSWNRTISLIREKRGDIPIIAFIDWSDTSETPLGAFSQNLSKENQSNFLRIADVFFQNKDIIFAYPMHGGFLGNDAQILSFGAYPYYDSLAPESNTYDTIQQLAAAKIR